MIRKEYAVVDIETTGGHAGNSGITEIAIFIYNGKEVIKRWQTLINPQQEIPFYITALTGISNAMVANAPLFEEVAEKIYHLLHNRIFVAHNVNFDYSFVRHQLEVAGYKWSARKLCTVRAARKIIPGLPSYSLGNLTQSLQIPLENHHRAGGDAAATTLLLQKLLSNDTNGHIEKMIKNTAKDQQLPPNLPVEDFENLPERPGVYYFYNKEHKVIYVGKAVNLKKRVASHFSGNKTTAQRQHFLKDIHKITFEICGNELMALLLECSEIQKLWPVYNKALKRYEPKYGLYTYEARSGYYYLVVGKLQKNQKCAHVFNTLQQGNECLRSLAQQFLIDYRFCKYATSLTEEFLVQTSQDNLPDLTKHNESIHAALDHLTQKKQSFLLTDKGRVKEEQSCILVENGCFYGMGYISSDFAITDFLQIKDCLTQYRSNQYMMQLIEKYASSNPDKIGRYILK